MPLNRHPGRSEAESRDPDCGAAAPGPGSARLAPLVRDDGDFESDYPSTNVRYSTFLNASFDASVQRLALAGGVGATLTATAPQQHGFLFGEDQARYLLTARAQDVAAIEAQALAAGVPVRLIGQTGGEALTLPGETPIVIADLVNAHEGWLPAYMASAPK